MCAWHLSPQVFVWNVKGCVEVRPWRTCEVCNVVKQVQPERKGSSATAHGLVTLWPSHHWAGGTVGGNVQIAYPSFSSFSPPIFSICPSSALFITHAHTCWNCFTASQPENYGSLIMTEQFADDLLILAFWHLSERSLLHPSQWILFTVPAAGQFVGFYLTALWQDYSSKLFPFLRV